MTLIIFGIILPWLFVGLGCWILYQLIRQNGRILLRLETFEQQLNQFGMDLTAGPSLPLAPAQPRGLPVGSPAPDFELPDLAGASRKLSEWRGRRVLLIFFSPGCGFCTRMASDIAALPTDGADGRPIPLVVTTGDKEANRGIVEQYGINCPVLLQEGMEVASAYQTSGTPTGYLIDEEGNIASPLAVGAPPLLALMDAKAAQQNGSNGSSGHKTYKGNRSLAESRINRSGLDPGTEAPAFRLPRLGGGELSLEEYRGRQVLIVFSDPNCGPCNQLAPRLEEIHRRTPDLGVVMVSRGEAEANRQKADEHGLTFPVVLQRQWEISRLYGIFATPVGYLIDEDGVIAAPVATGAGPILSLVENLQHAATKRAGDA